MRSQLALHRRGRSTSNGTPPPGPIVIPPDPSVDEPDTPEELAAVLATLNSHAQIDAWVQEHEANLPERPDTWSGLSRNNKKAWVTENYNFAAPDPVEPPDADEDADEDDGA